MKFCSVVKTCLFNENQLIDGEIWEWSGNCEKYERIPLDNILKALDRAINGQEE